MSTRSNIAYVDEGAVHSIYCHMDGYLDHTGRILFDHYNSFEKAKELVDLSNISFLEKTIALNRERSRCTNDEKAIHYRSISSYMYHVDPTSIEYIYMWDKNMWWIARSLSINTWDLSNMKRDITNLLVIILSLSHLPKNSPSGTSITLQTSRGSMSRLLYCFKMAFLYLII